MTFVLPKLPYAYNALEPYISERTMRIHHDKHHRAYIDKLNALMKDASLTGGTIEQIIRETAGNESLYGLFNNAAQSWNHDFYWRSIRPNGGGLPSGRIAAKIESDLGGYQEFVNQFTSAAMSQFGSGWAWLVLDDGKLKVTRTSNAYTPIARKRTPLLTIDVWEHAYYLDYQNRRPDYVAVFLEHLVNWDFANDNIAGYESRSHYFDPLVEHARASVGL